MLARTLGSRIEVVLDLAPALARAEVDATQLETALLNAAINARDAMPGGGRLTIATADITEGERRLVRISLTDTGLGMPPGVLERVFEPFFTTKGVGKGTGLGLSQIHGFAAQAGGRAEVHSTEGEGTTVAIFLPATDKALSAVSTESVQAELPAGLSVLLVEDNAEVRRFAEDLLRDLGCEVAAAESGEQAFERLANEPIDLLFSDVVMPGMSGVELARAARQQKPGLPVLLATGYSAEVVTNIPEFEVIPKPYRPQDLGQAISRVLGQRGERAA